MSILNEDLEFADAPAVVKDAFMRGVAEKKPFSRSTVLYRLVTNLQNTGIGEWWQASSALSEYRFRAMQASAPLADYSRARLAVSVDWNARMDSLCKVMLLEDVVGFEGRSRHQPLSRQLTNVLLIGGGNQIWIPNLTTRHTRIVYYGTAE